MDYEKMYKAVLETATQWIKDGCSDKEKICLESIFPELRESEDERIRKALIDALKVSETIGELKFRLPYPTREECIAYLEKQKECVADSSKTSANEDESIRKFLVDYFTSYKIGNVATKLNGVRIDDILNYLEKQKETANSFTDGVIEVRSFQRGIAEGRRLEKQKEQKPVDEQFPPLEGLDKIKAKYYDDGFKNGFDEGVESVKSAEWSKNDNVFLNEITDFFENNTIRLQHDLDMYAHWLKSLPERFNLQPKPEWSEEDTYTLNVVQRIVGQNKPNEIFKIGNKKAISSYQIATWLGTLPERFNLQSKQEWSEEDENKIESIKGLITMGKFVDTNTIKTIWKLLDSLRPQPKVEWSEEDERMRQTAIEACKTVAEDYENSNARFYKCKDWLEYRLKSLRPQPKDEIYKEKDNAFKLGKHQLAIQFMNYLDENRPEGKMSLSNGECEDIDKAFKENDWAKILRYAEKYGK